MTYGGLILISWIGIFLQLRFKQLIFYGAPVLLAAMLASNNAYLYMIQREQLDIKNSVHLLLDQRQAMLIGYVGISLMATISFKQLVFVSTPIYMIGMVYYDIKSKQLFDANMIE